MEMHLQSGASDRSNAVGRPEAFEFDFFVQSKFFWEARWVKIEDVHLTTVA